MSVFNKFFADNFDRTDTSFGTVNNDWTDELPGAYSVLGSNLVARTISASQQWRFRHLTRPTSENSLNQRYKIRVAAGAEEWFNFGAAARRTDSDNFILCGARLRDGVTEIYSVASGATTLRGSRSTPIADLDRLNKDYEIEVTVTGSSPSQVTVTLREVDGPNETSTTATILDSPLQSSAQFALTVYGFSGNAAQGEITSVELFNDESITIDHDDAKLIYSPSNWAIQPSYAETPNTGAYVKTRVSNSSFASLSIDRTPLSSGSIDPLTLGFRLNGGEWSYVNAASGSGDILLSEDLDPSFDYEIEVGMAWIERIDRWSTPSAIWRLNGFNFSPSASISPPNRGSKNILIYGDSITEGFNIGGNGVHNALSSFGWKLKELSGYEVGIVGWSAHGYVDNTGSGGVPGFSDTFDSLYDGESRDFSNLDYVLIVQGTNDRGLNQNSVEIIAENILSSLRSEVETETVVMLSIPPGGYCRSALESATNSHRATPDEKTVLIDLEEDGNFDGDGGVFMTDDLHPNQAGHDRLADLYWSQVQFFNDQFFPQTASRGMFGSDLVSISPDGANNLLSVKNLAGASLSDNYIILGGNPIAVYEKDGKLALGVVQVESFSKETGNFVFKGTSFGIYRNSYRSICLPVSIDSSVGEESSGYLILHGNKLSLSESGSLFVSIRNEAIDSTYTTVIGGAPITVAVIGGRGHLVVAAP